MTRWVFALLVLLGTTLAAEACPLCMGAARSSIADQLVEARRVTLAEPSADGRKYRVVASIKGERPASGEIDPADVYLKLDPAAIGNGAVLLVRDDLWKTWVGVGALPATHASWLRTIAAGKRASERTADDWHARVELMLPYLEHRESFVRDMAYAEIAAAPYSALLAAKSRIGAPAVRRWLGDPGLTGRESLYLLLLGIAGDDRDAAAIERRLDATMVAGDAANLGSLIAADLELRGPARLAWVDEHYLRDAKRSTREIEAALLALSVHGTANSTIPREQVIAVYRTFMSTHKDIAGYVARDFGEWQYWDAAPEYVALLKSGVRQQYPSQLAIVSYLRQAPNAGALGFDLSAAEPRTTVPGGAAVQQK